MSWSFGEGLQETLDATAAATLMEHVNYHHTMSRPSASGLRLVFVNMIQMLRTSWHDQTGCL